MLVTSVQPDLYLIGSNFFRTGGLAEAKRRTLCFLEDLHDLLHALARRAHRRRALAQLLTCGDCLPGHLLVKDAALDQLPALRERLGKPLIVRSAYRSPEHNRAVGGAKASKHLDGIAFDIAMADHYPEAFEGGPDSGIQGASASIRDPDSSKSISGGRGRWSGQPR